MARSRPKHFYLKIQNTTNGNNFKYQRNLFTILLQNPKFAYFIDLHVKDLSKNKKFWKKRQYFSERKR